ncbi:MAG: DUF547 domain-containing protein [Planctomycetota bacterium]
MNWNRIWNVSRLVCFLLGISLAIVLALRSTVSQAGKPVYVGAATSDTVPMVAIEHQAWDELLGKYVDDDGLVDYRGWKGNRADRTKLQNYLKHLSSASLAQSTDANVQLAFWINAYNAVTVEGILREYPTSSIRNHTAKLVGYNIWKDLKLHVDDKAVSLDEIEHQVLRKMSEPRIHFAIVCASVGCPRLLNEAYMAERLDEQLDTNARDFFSREQNFRFDSNRNQFSLSAILNWFGEDFGGSREALLKRLSPWLPSQAAKQTAARGEGTVSFLPYDWDLNKQ